MLNGLTYLKRPIYARIGSHDAAGFQIFTPEFIVNDMIEAVGLDEILDPTKSILEPASGDGAFVCRILSQRLGRIVDREPAKAALEALASLYSIEMDEELVRIQRNNIYTIMCDFAKEHDITDERWFTALEDIILSNIYWAVTFTDVDPAGGLLPIVAHQLPFPKRGGAKRPIVFHKWTIHADLTYDKEVEEIETY